MDSKCKSGTVLADSECKSGTVLAESANSVESQLSTDCILRIENWNIDFGEQRGRTFNVLIDTSGKDWQK